MGQLLLILTSALVVGAVVFGVSVLITGGDPGLETVEPDGRAIPLPTSRPLAEGDVTQARFDTALRGYRMGQVDQALSRVAYDIGYKDELITVLEAEITALRSGRLADAEVLRRAREAALSGGGREASVGTGESPAPLDDAVPAPEESTQDQVDAWLESTRTEDPEPAAEPEVDVSPQPEAEASPEAEAEAEATADAQSDTPAEPQRDTEPDSDAISRQR